MSPRAIRTYTEAAQWFAAGFLLTAGVTGWAEVAAVLPHMRDGLTRTIAQPRRRQRVPRWMRNSPQRLTRTEL
jgi:hypothetical protein